MSKLYVNGTQSLASVEVDTENLHRRNGAVLLLQPRVCRVKHRSNSLLQGSEREQVGDKSLYRNHTEGDVLLVPSVVGDDAVDSTRCTPQARAL